MMESPKAGYLINYVDIIWFYRYFIQTELSSDDDFNRKSTRKALKGRLIGFKPILALGHKNYGLLERKIGTKGRVFRRPFS